MLKGNAVYAQSGGVTSVINASMYGVLKAVSQADMIENIYGGHFGINGILDENLVDFSQEHPETIEALRHTPGAALGSCRRKLPDLFQHRNYFKRIVDVFSAHNIRYFFYNGGNDSMDTAYKVSQIAGELGYDLICVGIPKTVDNDLPLTDNCPGYGSAAKYNLVSILEGGLDVASMCMDSTKVFVMETMGRHSGWIAASTALARRDEGDPPHVILMPEVAFDQDAFLKKVDATVAKYHHCVISVSEGVKNPEGRYLSDAGYSDNFGNVQLGGVVQVIKSMLLRELGLKSHGALLDYCQRSARHIASRVDVEQAVACGKTAVYLAQEQLNGRMVTIVRENQEPYRWGLAHANLAEIAGKEKALPNEYISQDGMDVTPAFIEYGRPLVMGEDYPEYELGVPVYARLNMNLVEKKLPPFDKNEG